MPVLSQRRQITLPRKLCDRLALLPCDDLQILEHQGRITILKRTRGASKGVLSHLRIHRRVSDTDSRDGAIASAGRGSAKRRRP
jgi:hypothetical protein